MSLRSVAVELGSRAYAIHIGPGADRRAGGVARRGARTPCAGGDQPGRGRALRRPRGGGTGRARGPRARGARGRSPQDPGRSGPRVRRAGRAQGQPRRHRGRAGRRRDRRPRRIRRGLLDARRAPWCRCRPRCWRWSIRRSAARPRWTCPRARTWSAPSTSRARWWPTPTPCATLPERELRAGLAEVLKYGAIGDPAFLDWLAAHADALLAREPGATTHAIETSCRHKAGDRRARRARNRRARAAQFRPHLRPCAGNRHRLRGAAPRRGGGDRDGARGAAVGGAGPGGRCAGARTRRGAGALRPAHRAPAGLAPERLLETHAPGQEGPERPAAPGAVARSRAAPKWCRTCRRTRFLPCCAESRGRRRGASARLRACGYSCKPSPRAARRRSTAT